MTQEWMNDSTLEGIDPAKMALLQSLIQQGSKKKSERNACIFNVCSSQFKEKRTAVQPRRDRYDYKGIKKRKIIAGSCKNGPDPVDDENAPAGIKE